MRGRSQQQTTLEKRERERAGRTGSDGRNGKRHGHNNKLGQTKKEPMTDAQSVGTTGQGRGQGTPRAEPTADSTKRVDGRTRTRGRAESKRERSRDPAKGDKTPDVVKASYETGSKGNTNQAAEAANPGDQQQEKQKQCNEQADGKRRRTQIGNAAKRTYGTPARRRRTQRPRP